MIKEDKISRTELDDIESALMFSLEKGKFKEFQKAPITSAIAIVRDLRYKCFTKDIIDSIGKEDK